MARQQLFSPSFTTSALLKSARTLRKLPVFLLLSSAASGCGAAFDPGAESGGTGGVSGTAGHSGSMPDQGDSGSGGDVGSAGDAGSGSGGGGEGGMSDCRQSGTSDCGEGDEGGEGGEGGEGEHEPLELTFADRFVIKVQARSDGALFVLLDKPLDMRVDWGSPQRELLLFDAAGRRLKSVAVSTNSRFLLDFAVHPLDDVSVLYSSATEYSLERFNAQAQSVGGNVLSDSQIDQDSPVWNGSPSAAVESLTRDAGRIAAFGEQLVVATRTGRHSVIAQRFGFFNDGLGAAFHAEWRTLVVPPFSLANVALTGGSYDTFSAVHAQAMLHLAVD